MFVYNAVTHMKSEMICCIIEWMQFLWCHGELKLNVSKNCCEKNIYKMLIDKGGSKFWQWNISVFRWWKEQTNECEWKDIIQFLQT